MEFIEDANNGEDVAVALDLFPDRRLALKQVGGGIVPQNDDIGAASLFVLRPEAAIKHVDLPCGLHVRGVAAENRIVHLTLAVLYRDRTDSQLKVLIAQRQDRPQLRAATRESRGRPQR